MGKQYLNGVLYGTGEIIKFSPYIYSLEEREVGVWTDGKPLYEKTVHVGSITRNTTKTVTCDVGAEKMVHLIGYAYSSYYHQWFSLPYYHGQSRYCVNFLYLDNNNSNGPAISVTTGSELDLDDCYVTLQYTKTTDNPGSGHYTTKGGEAHHYSTSEQIVGTWIDGKPLYERTYDFTINDLYIGNHGEISSSLIRGEFQLPSLDTIGYDQIWIEQSYLTDKKPVGINTVISNSLIYASNGSYIRTNLQYSTYTFIFLDMTYSASSFYTDKNNLHFVFVIRYTKTTD